jgi:NADH pyrophosphatase NudC (nudix superfamily)
MVIGLAVALTAATLFFLLFIRQKDLPVTPPVSPFAHLDERKASIYENLRDLQFEYRVGKMSDADYQRSKIDLQKELARVLTEVEKLAQSQAQPVKVKSVPQAAKAAPKTNVCPHCSAEFAQSLKFCGECGKPMKA